MKIGPTVRPRRMPEKKGQDRIGQDSQKGHNCVILHLFGQTSHWTETNAFVTFFDCPVLSGGLRFYRDSIYLLSFFLSFFDRYTRNCWTELNQNRPYARK